MSLRQNEQTTMSLNCQERLTLKVVLLGNARVGKTSLLTKHFLQSFNKTETSTTKTIAFFSQQVNWNAKSLKFDFWDTCGQEQWHALGPLYYRDAHGVIIVCDITDENSIARTQNWISEVQIVNDRAEIIIVANQIDRLSESHLKQIRNQLSVKLHKKNLFFTSAKTGTGVDQVFESMIRLCLSKYIEPQKSTRVLLDDRQLAYSQARCMCS